jgi:anti-sigma factor RsiW
MANTPDAYEKLSAYLDGEVTEAERAEVERLLARDPRAREILEGLSRTSRLVGRLDKVSAPPGFAEAVTARLEREALLGAGASRANGQPTGTPWRGAVGVAAGLAMLCTAGWLFWPKTGGRWGGEAAAPIAPGSFIDVGANLDAVDSEVRLSGASPAAAETALTGAPRPATATPGSAGPLASAGGTFGNVESELPTEERPHAGIPNVGRLAAKSVAAPAMSVPETARAVKWLGGGATTMSTQVAPARVAASRPAASQPAASQPTSRGADRD